MVDVPRACVLLEVQEMRHFMHQVDDESVRPLYHRELRGRSIFNYRNTLRREVSLSPTLSALMYLGTKKMVRSAVLLLSPAKYFRKF